MRVFHSVIFLLNNLHSHTQKATQWVGGTICVGVFNIIVSIDYLGLIFDS